MFKKNRHTDDVWHRITHPRITPRKPEESPRAVGRPQTPACRPAVSTPGKCASPTGLTREGPQLFKALRPTILLLHRPKPQTPAGSKDKKAGLTAVVVRLLTAAGKATSFHDLPGKQQAACKAMRQHLTQDDNTLSSSCASDGSPGFTAHKGKQSASSSIGMVNTEKPKDT